eukprot:1875690-Rhodomonas_salina.1
MSTATSVPFPSVVPGAYQVVAEVRVVEAVSELRCSEPLPHTRSVSAGPWGGEVSQTAHVRPKSPHTCMRPKSPHTCMRPKSPHTCTLSETDCQTPHSWFFRVRRVRVLGGACAPRPRESRKGTLLVFVEDVSLVAEQQLRDPLRPPPSN